MAAESKSKDPHRIHTFDPLRAFTGELTKIVNIAVLETTIREKTYIDALLESIFINGESPLIT